MKIKLILGSLLNLIKHDCVIGRDGGENILFLNTARLLVTFSSKGKYENSSQIREAPWVWECFFYKIGMMQEEISRGRLTSMAGVIGAHPHPPHWATHSHTNTNM